MKLSPGGLARLEAWLGTETWSSGHTLDIHRLYEFVDQYSRDDGSAIDPDELAAEAHAAFGFTPSEFKLGKLRTSVDKANEILDFLAFTHRLQS